MTPASLVAALLSALNPGIVEKLARPVMDMLLVTATPTLFLISLYVRLFETQAAMIGGSGRYALALRDIALYGTLLVFYALLGGLVGRYLDSLYAALGDVGSLRAVSAQMTALLKLAERRPQGAWASLEEINALPMQIATVAIYYLTLVVTAFLEALLRIAEVLGYEFAFLYGLIALPLAVSSTFSLARGWAKLMGFFLLWPVVQALLLAVFAPLFTQALKTLMQVVGPSDYMVVYAHMLFTVLNLLLCTVLLAAPYVTGALIENAGAMQPFLAPYLTALGGTGLAVAASLESHVRARLEEWPQERAPMAFDPRPMPELHVPPDPDFHDSLANEDVPRTNYLDPEFDKPPPKE